MKEWYSVKELVGLPYMPTTVQGLIKRSLSENWLSRPREGRGGGREYHISSLPEETRVHLLAPYAAPPPTADDLSAWLARRRITISPKQLADPVMQRKLACVRAVSACPAYQGREKLIEALASQHGVSPITIRRWVDDIETLPVRSSLPRIKLGDEKVDIPTSHAFTPEALACGLMSYANDMKAGMRSAYRSMESQASARDWQLGDYSSFTRIVKKIPAAIWVRIRRGATGFELACTPKIIRQWTAVPVQSVLCGDQKIFDYMVYDPEIDEIIIPNGYLWMDCSSRMINGAWVELGHYNSYTVGNSLREALRFGIPDEIFTDWGKPEGSKHISNILKGLNGHSTTGDFMAMAEKYAALDDNVRHRKAEPGKPWQKPIENIMNLIEGRLVAKNLPGYRKRMADAWVNKETQALLKAQAKRGQLMTIEQFITHVYTAIDEHNKAEKDLKEGFSIVPLDFFARGLTAQSRPVFDTTTLDHICLPTFERMPHQSKITVTIKGEQRGYYSPRLAGYRHKLRISVDPYDREAPAVLTAQDGTYFDLAEPWHVQNPYDRDGLSMKRHRQRELMKWVSEQAHRVRAGFDLYKPEVSEKSPIKLTSATSTARRAEEEKKVYQLRKIEQSGERKRIVEAAAREQKLLAAEFSTGEGDELDGWKLPEGRERYTYWVALKHRVELNQPLTEKETYFYVHYPHTGDFRTCSSLHEEYGEIYLGGQA
jgi:hypothetical protein